MSKAFLHAKMRAVLLNSKFKENGSGGFGSAILKDCCSWLYWGLTPLLTAKVILWGSMKHMLSGFES